MSNRFVTNQILSALTRLTIGLESPTGLISKRLLSSAPSSSQPDSSSTSFNPSVSSLATHRSLGRKTKQGQPSSSGSYKLQRRREAAEAGRLIVTEAPWPFIDTTLPNILPFYLDPVGDKRVSKPSVSVNEAIQAVKAASSTRISGSSERDRLSGRSRCLTSFDETIELILNLNVNPRKSDQLVRGGVTLPHGSGQAFTICVIAKGQEAEVAKGAGADVVGDEALIESIVSSNGKAISFDKLICTPDMNKALARAGKILGPKGLMPNVKLGTLTSDVASAIKEIRRGRLDYRVDRDGIVHTLVGKVSFSDEMLLDNIKALFSSLIAMRPKSLGEGSSGAEGYIKSIFIKASMTPSVKISVQSVIDLDHHQLKAPI